MMLKKLIFLLSFLFLLLVACGHFAPDIRLKRAVSAEEIIGRWELTPETLRFLKTTDGTKYAPKPETKHEVVFHKDGRCDFDSVVEGRWQEGSIPCEYWSLKGNWHLKEVTEGGKTTNFPAIKLKGFDGGAIYTGFQLTEENGKILLWTYWGDPDSWEFLKYAKTADKPKP